MKYLSLLALVALFMAAPKANAMSANYEARIWEITTLDGRSLSAPLPPGVLSNTLNFNSKEEARTHLGASASQSLAQLATEACENALQAYHYTIPANEALVLGFAKIMDTKSGEIIDTRFMVGVRCSNFLKPVRASYFAQISGVKTLDGRPLDLPFQMPATQAIQQYSSLGEARYKILNNASAGLANIAGKACQTAVAAYNNTIPPQNLRVFGFAYMINHHISLQEGPATSEDLSSDFMKKMNNGILCSDYLGRR